MRFSPTGHLFETKGSECFFNNDNVLYYVLGEVNSKIVYQLLEVLCPTVDFHEGPIGKIPIIYSADKADGIIKLVQDCIHISKRELDSFETSWNFVCHPLIPCYSNHISIEKKDLVISECYKHWESECNERFVKLKDNEETLNKLFITIYGFFNF